METVFTGDFAISRTGETVSKVFLPIPALGKLSQRVFHEISHWGNRLKSFFAISHTGEIVSKNFLWNLAIGSCFTKDDELIGDKKATCSLDYWTLDKWIKRVHIQGISIYKLKRVKPPTVLSKGNF